MKENVNEVSSNKPNNIPLLILTCVFLVLGGLVVYLPLNFVNTTSQKISEDFKDNYDNYKTLANNQISNYIYEVNEKANKSSGQLFITLGNIQEESNLQVLQVGHDAYVFEDKDENPKRTTVWQVFSAYGTYSVDLGMAEFLVDNANKTVDVMVPDPILEWTFVYDNNENQNSIIFQEDDIDITIWENPGDITAQIQARQLEEAKQEMNAYFYNNKENENKAREATIESVARMIRMLNPTVEDLTVTVSFYSDK